MRPIELLDVFAPVLLVAGAIALVAVVYLIGTAVKDRASRRREERLAVEERARRAPRGQGDRASRR